MKRIIIEIIEPGQHREGITGADWQYFPNGDVIVRVTGMSDWHRTICLIVHELVEAVLCMAEGVTWESVDEFDKWFDATYAAVKKNTEAGDHPRAPYRRQHNFATGIERLLCERFGLDWESYDDEIARLG